jgi:hypothetical protein
MVSKSNSRSHLNTLVMAAVILVSLVMVGCTGWQDGKPASLSGRITLEGVVWEHPVDIAIINVDEGVFSEGRYEFNNLTSGYITLWASTTTSTAYYEMEQTWRIRPGQNTFDIKFTSLFATPLE